jgi:hypothetical protein
VSTTAGHRQRSDRKRQLKVDGQEVDGQKSKDDLPGSIITIARLTSWYSSWIDKEPDRRQRAAAWSGRLSPSRICRGCRSKDAS